MENTKNADIRVNNRKRVINTLFRKGAMTKQDLAGRLGLSLPTVTLLLKELKEKGLVANGDVLNSTGGRKPVLLTPVYDVKYTMGFEISLHELRMVILDLGGNVAAKELIPHEFDVTEKYWKMISSEVADFIARNIADRSKLMIGGMALQVPMKRRKDLWEGIIRGEKKSFTFQTLQSCFPWPLTVHESVKMAAIAQIWTMDQLPDSFLYMSIGSLLSGAIVHEKRVLGYEVANGRFDRVLLGVHRPGERMEDYCTIDALCRRSSCATAEEFFAKAEAGDETCGRIWEETLEILTVFLYNMNNVFGWKVVVGGALSRYLEPLEDRINARLEELDNDPGGYVPSVIVSDSGAYSAAMGAAMSAIDRFLEFGFSDM